MNQAEEDALVNEIFDKSWRTEPGAQTSLFNMAESIRLAIRAAVAAERERAAKVCEQEHADWFKDPGYDMPDGRDCAAAIRRGE